MQVIRPDDLLPQGPGRWTRENVANAWAEAHRQLRAALADPEVHEVVCMVGVPGSGKSSHCSRLDLPGVVVFDGVFAEPPRRAAMARRIKAAGKRARAVWVRTPLDLALERNELRPFWRRVPEVFCRHAAYMLDRYPPTTAEGWDAVDEVDGAGPRQLVAELPADHEGQPLRLDADKARQRAAAHASTDDLEAAEAQWIRLWQRVGGEAGRITTGAVEAAPGISGQAGGGAARRVRGATRAAEQAHRKAWPASRVKEAAEAHFDKVARIALRRFRAQVGESDLDDGQVERLLEADPDHDKARRAFVQRAVERSRALAASHADKVDEVVGEAVREGASDEQVASLLRERASVTRSRAAQAAADATAEANAAATRAIHKAAGVPGYLWRTQLDDRVRPHHAAREGKFYGWKNPPSGGHPGEDYGCRCWAEPDLSTVRKDSAGRWLFVSREAA